VCFAFAKSRSSPPGLPLAPLIFGPIRAGFIVTSNLLIGYRARQALNVWTPFIGILNPHNVIAIHLDNAPVPIFPIGDMTCEDWTSQGFWHVFLREEMTFNLLLPRKGDHHLSMTTPDEILTFSKDLVPQFLYGPPIQP